MTRWPVVEVDEVAALRLFAVVVLPTVLSLMVFAPAVTWIPTSEAEMVVSVPLVVMEPMVFLAMALVPVPAAAMPKLVPPLPDVVTEMEPVPVPLPMVLPVTVPMFTEPACT
jgi:hypothetical protein